MRVFKFEFRPNGSRATALAAALEKAEAAGRLELPFTLTEVVYHQYRDGGNVNKATCRAYRVTLDDSPFEEPE